MRLMSYAAHRPPADPAVAVVVVVVGRVNVSSREVQVVGIAAAVDRTRPVVRFRAWIVETTADDEAGPHKP